jgi:hypothetical protein
VTAPEPVPTCALCGGAATVALEPPRRTLARGLDRSDPSFSVTVILPDVPLCAEHAVAVRQGDRRVGWCDGEGCRAYGEVDETSPCGVPYQRLEPSRSRPAPPHAPSTRQSDQ